jgi:hypothetical protein
MIGCYIEEIEFTRLMVSLCLVQRETMNAVNCSAFIPFQFPAFPQSRLLLWCRASSFVGRPNFPVISGRFLGKIRPLSGRKRPNFLEKAAKHFYHLHDGHRGNPTSAIAFPGKVVRGHSVCSLPGSRDRELLRSLTGLPTMRGIVEHTQHDT